MRRLSTSGQHIRSTSCAELIGVYKQQIVKNHLHNELFTEDIQLFVKFNCSTKSFVKFNNYFKIDVIIQSKPVKDRYAVAFVGRSVHEALHFN